LIAYFILNSHINWSDDLCMKKKIITSTLLISLLVFGGCGKSKAQKEAEAVKAAEAASKAEAELEARKEAQIRAQTIKTLQDKVVETMKDPASVQFRSVHLGSTDDTLCGEVNAKNSYGGYVGFRPFIVINDQVIITAPTESATFEQNLMNMRYISELKNSGCQSE
jgi:hypothetical protein